MKLSSRTKFLDTSIELVWCRPNASLNEWKIPKQMQEMNDNAAIQASQRQRQMLCLFSAACFSKLAFTFQNTYRKVHVHTHSGIDEKQHPAVIELWLYLQTHIRTHSKRRTFNSLDALYAHKLTSYTHTHTPIHSLPWDNFQCVKVMCNGVWLSNSQSTKHLLYPLQYTVLLTTEHTCVHIISSLTDLL